MIITEIYTRIGQLASDPALTEYLAAMPNAFESAMCNIIKTGDFVQEEIPALVEIYSSVSTGSSFHDNVRCVSITELSNILKIVNITHKDFTFKVINQDDIHNILRNPIRLPMKDEAFWYIADNNIYFIVNNDQERFKVNISAIHNPDPATWTEQKVDLISDLKYGRSFILKCITEAAVYIREQINGEMKSE